MELIDLNEIRTIISGRVIRALTFVLLIISNSLSNSSGYILRGHYHLTTDIDSMTDAQQEDLKWFSRRVCPYLPDDFMKTDFYLLRWLQATNFNCDEAMWMLHENVRWRLENNIKDILCEDFSDVCDYLPVTTNTMDKEGLPVGTMKLGPWDIRKTGFIGKLSRVFRYVHRFEEVLMQQILAVRMSGQNVTQAVVLVDLEGVTEEKHMCESCVSEYVYLIHQMNAHFPGFWKEIILINSPPKFDNVIDTIYLEMSPISRQALRIFGTDKEKWGAYLSERIDSEQRYESFGGTKSVAST